MLFSTPVVTGRISDEDNGLSVKMIRQSLGFLRRIIVSGFKLQILC